MAELDALFGAFIAAGMDMSEELLHHWNKGCIELVDEAVAVVPLVHILLDKAGAQGFPGVYEYEVLEPYGKWLCTQLMASKTGDIPSLTERENYICAETAKFFAQDNEAESVRIYSMLCAATQEYQFELSEDEL